MNITRENLGELDLCIKVEVAENDYAENVAKQLKKYRNNATIPGFRKGMAPMGMIQRLYGAAILSDEVNNVVGQSLYKYLDDEKLDIIGSPLANEEKTGDIDFEHAKEFTFYFDAAMMPVVNLAWDKVETKLCQIKVSAKDIDKQVEEISQRMGNFETPETVGEKDYVYGKAVELDKQGNVKEGGVSTFTSFDLSSVKDPEIVALFVGKKNEDKVVFNAGKAFTAADIEKNFHLETAAAKKFKADVEFAISGCSRITPHEVNEELFAKVFPNDEIKDVAAFRKQLSKEMDKGNNEQCEILYVNEVRKALLDNFDAALPEAFLKRWILSRGDKDVTAESIETNWAEKYVPGLKWELIDAALNKIKNIEPTHNDVVDAVKEILRSNDRKVEGESAEAAEKRIEEAAQSIAKEKNNVQQIYDKLYMQKTFALFKEQLNPEVEKVSVKEFTERCK